MIKPAGKKKKGIASILILLFILIIPITAAIVFYSVKSSPSKTIRASSFTTAGQPFTACTTNCGDPRGFCDTWTGGFCDDYRDIYCPVHCEFPATVNRTTKNDITTFSSTDPSYVPAGIHGAPPFCYDSKGQAVTLPIPDPETAAAAIGGVECNGFFGNDQEHFHSQVEDGDFGIAINRITQPIDFTGRTGHIHFDVDLKTSARRYVRMMLSPQLTKMVVDDRGDNARPCPALDLWFINGSIKSNEYKGGAGNCSGSIYGNVFDSPNGYRYYGTENIRDHIDVYVSRTHLKVTITHPDNKTIDVPWDGVIPDVGFEQAYLYLVQASYNPVKDSPLGDSHGTIAAEAYPESQIFHWDNVAFDGPALPNNYFTPIGSRDVMFNVYGAMNCTVAGVAARAVSTPFESSSGYHGYGWLSWIARLPDDGTSVSRSDVKCSGGGSGDPTGFNFFDGVPRSFEVVRQGAPGGGTGGSPSPTPVLSPSPTGVATPTPTVVPTPIPTPIPTPSPSPKPTPSPVPSPCTTCTTGTVNFNDWTGGFEQAYSGQYPTGLIDWGTNQWFITSAWRQMTTPDISFNGPAGLSAATFRFISPRRVANIDVFNGGTVASSVSISCDSTVKVQTVNVDQYVTINTGFSSPCTSVTLSSSNGWDTNFDNIAYDMGVGLPSPIPTPIPSTGSFTAQYFPNTTLSGSAVATVNNVASANFDWGLNSPTPPFGAGLPVNNFSVRFSGDFNFDGSTYRFNASGDDGIRVIVDGTTIIDGWRDQQTTTYNALKTLSGVHNVVITYYDHTGHAVVRANWVHAATCFDMTGDGRVSQSDVNVVGAHNAAKGVTPWDVNGDKVVNSLDLDIVSKKLGTSCS